MKIKKRRKSSRISSRYRGHGAARHRKSGRKGGYGMAGTGKRSGHKRTLLFTKDEKYLGKRGITSKRAKKKGMNVINLSDIESKFKEGEINLKGYKILGEGSVSKKFIITAEAASQSARESIEKAGGKIITKKKEKEEKREDSEGKISKKTTGVLAENKVENKNDKKEVRNEKKQEVKERKEEKNNSVKNKK